MLGTFRKFVSRVKREYTAARQVCKETLANLNHDDHHAKFAFQPKEDEREFQLGAREVEVEKDLVGMARKEKDGNNPSVENHQAREASSAPNIVEDAYPLVKNYHFKEPSAARKVEDGNQASSAATLRDKLQQVFNDPNLPVTYKPEVHHSITFMDSNEKMLQKLITQALRDATFIDNNDKIVKGKLSPSATSSENLEPPPPPSSQEPAQKEPRLPSMKDLVNRPWLVKMRANEMGLPFLRCFALDDDGELLEVLGQVIPPGPFQPHQPKPWKPTRQKLKLREVPPSPRCTKHKHLQAPTRYELVRQTKVLVTVLSAQLSHHRPIEPKIHAQHAPTDTRRSINHSERRATGAAEEDDSDLSSDDEKEKQHRRHHQDHDEESDLSSDDYKEKRREHRHFVRPPWDSRSNDGPRPSVRERRHTRSPSEDMTRERERQRKKRKEREKMRQLQKKLLRQQKAKLFQMQVERRMKREKDRQARSALTYANNQAAIAGALRPAAGMRMM